ncbi:Uncharacterized protein PHSC3_000001 [Chlamydiales bacterium STE3]|nr:Uncharacterized protein PHSC3_000001 [Chlamydiales bacterium STE3]
MYTPCPSVCLTEPLYALCSSAGYSVNRGHRGLSQTFARSDFIQIQRNGITYHQPINISFLCIRNASKIDSSVKKIYQAIVKGQAARLLAANPHGCAAGQNIGHCGNVRGSLAECKCYILDRKRDPRLRHVYENSVIQQVLGLIGDNKHNFEVRIAMFATGQLHGEQCLLIRLIDFLKNNDYRGAIHISLIDTDYKGSIAVSYSATQTPAGQTFPWTQLLGHRKDLEQFVVELSLCLPPSITLSGAVFESAKDYMFKAQQFGYKHDLMIGADLDGADGIMARTDAAASQRFLPAIALVKRLENAQVVPRICHIRPDTEDCYCV